MARPQGDVESGRTERAPPPVIRKLAYAEESVSSRILKKHVPAWVISGFIHIGFVLTALLFFDKVVVTEAKNEDKIVTTVTEEEKTKDENLTETDIGIDAELKAATDSPREDMENVDAPTAMEEPVGTPQDTTEIPTQSSQLPGAPSLDNLGGTVGDLSTMGAQAIGAGGGANGSLMVSGMRGRSGATKDAMLKAGGGNTMTEAAVAEGLVWLSKQQKLGQANGRTYGYWTYAGSKDDNAGAGSSKEDIAATGMALLPFLAAGETHKSAKKYQKIVAQGLDYLVMKQRASTTPGTFVGSSTMYAHAIGAIALCEAYGMTSDPALKGPAQSALNYIITGQGTDGSWGYSHAANGDTSIVGWQIQALKSGKVSGLNVPDKTFKKAVEFLDKVSDNAGATYGYAAKGASPNLTPVGLLCRYYLGWGPKNPAMARGVEVLKRTPPVLQAPLNMYFLYYATQVVHFMEGPNWYDLWNPKMQETLLGKQIKTPGINKGSWDKDAGSIGGPCGRLGTTCLAILTLEVFYRHLPLYKRGDGGLAELEKGN